VRVRCKDCLVPFELMSECSTCEGQCIECCECLSNEEMCICSNCNLPDEICNCIKELEIPELGITVDVCQRCFLLSNKCKC
jgi:hypothetical protein